MICILAPFNPSSLKNYFEDLKDLPNINTSATSINNLVLGLLEEGQDVLVITLDYTTATTLRYEAENIVVVTIGARSNFFMFNLFPNLSRAASLICNEINRYSDNITLIHAHWCYEYALAGRQFSNKYVTVVTIRDFAPVIYESISLWSSVYSFFAKFYWLYKCKVFNEIVRSEDIFFISNSIYTENKIRGFNENINVTTIPNSIEDKLLVNSLPSLSGRKNIVTIAASVDDERKNIKKLVDAFKLFKQTRNDCKLVIIGNYHLYKGIHQYTIDKDLRGDVIFTGRLNRSEIVNEIDKSILMVHPAYEETFGNILLEAMSRGVPCIGGKNAGAVPWVLEDGKSGILCDIDNPSGICESIVSLLKDNVHRDFIRHNALEYIRNNYSNTAVAKKHIEYYNKLLQKE